ncbi:leucyl/phenylalanyl-tRNA--protein transferase [Planctomycetota bacterium]
MQPSELEPFPDPRFARAWGPLALGGDLSPQRLLLAYSSGIFPWFSEGEPIQWWSPDPRAVFELDGLHVPRRLLRTIRSGRFTVTRDSAFAAVMHGCAHRPGSGTWITQSMLEAYERLHQLGFARSLEVWRNGELAGGIYGVSIGGLFAGESMFYHERDASKVALYWLEEHLRSRGYVLFDVQMLTPHLERLGAIDIPRTHYLRRLREAIALPVTWD